jgi:multidrug efflux pump subunit AcrA (membrane-fusion protein)
LRTELDLPNPKGVLRPGMYATVHIVLQERRDVLTVPVSAVVAADKQSFCWTVHEGRAVRKPLVLGLQVGGDVEVLSGLQGDERVVQSLSGTLEEGQAVEIEAGGH